MARYAVLPSGSKDVVEITVGGHEIRAEGIDPHDPVRFRIDPDELCRACDLRPEERTARVDHPEIPVMHPDTVDVDEAAGHRGTRPRRIPGSARIGLEPILSDVGE